MTRITPDHLARGAFVYVRQSTSDQVLHNHESRHRQYGLVEVGPSDITTNLPYQPDDMDVCGRLFALARRDAAAMRYQRDAAVVHESSPGPYRVEMSADDLGLFLRGIDPSEVRRRPRYRKSATA